MGVFAGPEVVSEGLTLSLDVGNNKSYPGSGSTWTDLSGRNNTGTLINSPTYNSSTGGYLSFNGTTQYANCTDSPLNVTSYTKSVWFRLSSFGTNNNLVSCSPGHFMFFSGTSTLYCGHSDWGVYTAYPSTTNFSTATWYNACLTFNTTDGMVLYVNGVQDSTYTAVKTQAAGGGIEIGSFASGNLLTGDISQVLVYNRSITASEARQNFNALRGRYGI